MRNFPFAVNPRRAPEKIRIGNEDVGIIEIERRGYLTTGEKLSYQQINTNQEGRKALAGLYTKVADEEKISPDKARALVNKVLDQKKTSPKEQEVIEKYAEDFLLMFEVFKREAMFTQIMMATILLMSRVDPNTTFEEVSSLDQLLVEQLAELYDAEEKKSLESLSFTEPTPDSPTPDAAVGKGVAVPVAAPA